MIFGGILLAGLVLILTCRIIYHYLIGKGHSHISERGNAVDYSTQSERAEIINVNVNSSSISHRQPTYLYRNTTITEHTIS